MAKLLKLRRGTTSQHSSFTGAEGEVTIDTTKDTAVVHDGTTQSGRPLAREDMSNVSSASIAGQLGADSIATSKIAAGALPTDVTVTNANVVSNAAIAGTKISPDFGSQDITTTGKVLFANVYNAEGDLPSASTYHGMFAHVHGTGAAYYSHAGAWIKLAPLDAPDFTGGIDVTGTITSTGNITISNNAPSLFFTEGDGNPDYQLLTNGGQFRIYDVTNTTNRIVVNANGSVSIPGTTVFGAGVDVTGNITLSGTVDGVDIAARNTLFGGLTSSSGVLTNGVTATTQSAGDSSTKVATTAYTDTAISNLVDSSPSALNTLNELAAALGDDANFAATTATSLGTKLPKSGGEMTGNITFSGSQTVDGRDLSADGSKLDGIESGATADQTAAEIRALVESASDSNVFTNADHNKLNAIESNATADQSASEIRTLVANASDSNVFTDADHTKLNGIETGATADQTGGEIASALNGQNIYTTGGIGRDSNDQISWSNDSYMNIHIAGNNRFRFESDGDFHADGDVIAYSNTTSSDERLKKDITSIENALAKIGHLRGVTFTWKKDDKKSAGVIAQEVQKVLPEAVSTIADLNSGEEHLGVNYNALIGVLLEAIKELEIRVNLLEGDD